MDIHRQPTGGGRHRRPVRRSGGSTHRGRTAALAAAFTALAVGLPAGAAPAAAPPGSPSGPARSTGTPETVVTLLTGDRVRVTRTPAGDQALGIEPAPGREGIGFLRDARSGPDGRDLSLVPADAVPLLASGRVDPRLFDVTELIRQGQTGSGGSLPLIVTYRKPAGPGVAAVRAPGSTGVARALPSVNGAALRQDRSRRAELWNWLTGRTAGRDRAAVAPATLAAGVEKVWLDAMAKPALDVSVPQIGAPVAWRAGFTGAGVTVGILDTGVDAAHPDLAGRVTESVDFTGTRPDGGDDVGHGTHVAGIIAGNGVASAGRYRGVAPDATLVSGKVCTARACPTSAVIAGMEWIAPKAPVVNMSLGTGATDGTDPMSTALNSLSARYGTLFVVAAGDGDDPTETVGAPAVADAALAVGSVNADDVTSPFSLRGPRAGDGAVKPDVAAPGEGIVSARATGTPAGDADPVDEHYTRMSGTSMASPHVAGAAAILAQAHPDWRADRLKPALTGSAAPTGPVPEQGAGRVDVGRAVSQQVTATGAGITFGQLRWPHPTQVTRTVGYRNDGDTPVTLTVAVTTTGGDGQPAPDGLVTPATDRVTVPAHGTAQLDVTLHPGTGTTGRFSGRITATADGTAVRTAFTGWLEPESYDLTVRVVSRTGQQATVLGQIVDAATGRAYGLRTVPGWDTAVVRLPKGRYDVNAFDVCLDPAGGEQPYQVTLMSRPDVTLGADTTVALDATAGRPVTLTVDRAGAERQSGEFGVVSGEPSGVSGGALSWFLTDQYRPYATPTATTATDHTYAYFVRATLAETSLENPVEYVYQLARLERGRIPADPGITAHDRDLARVDARYRSQGVPGTHGLRADFARLPLPYTGVGIYPVYPHLAPSARTEYYTADPDVTWQHLYAVGPEDQSDLEIQWSVRSYRSGRFTADWNTAPVGPAFGDPSLGYGVQRVDDQLQVAVTLFSGSDPEQFTEAPLAATGTTTLSRGSTVLGTSEFPGFGVFPLADGAATYTLRATAERVVPWSVIGSRADVTWTFPEAGRATTAPPKLLTVRARGLVDELDRAPAGVPYPLALTVRSQPGTSVGQLTALGVQVSYDDGATWRAVPVVRAGAGGVATLSHPAGDGFASLRLTARTADGSAVTQTVIRAYQIHAG